MDENGLSLRQLSFQQTYQQLTFLHDLEHPVLSMDFPQFKRKISHNLENRILKNPILFFASEEFHYNRDKLDHQSDQQLDQVLSHK